MKTMSLRKRLVLGIAFVTLSLVLFAQQKGTRARILEKSGDYWVLNKGSEDGVQAGMRGTFWTRQKSGDKEYDVDIARFKVVRVENKRCLVQVEEIGPGFSEKYFQWATFREKLTPPKKIIPPEQPPKTGVKEKIEIPSGQSIEWYMKKGEEYYESGKYKLAEACYLRVLEKDSEDPGALFGLKKIKEKLAAVEKQADLKERKAKRDGYIARGDLFFKEGNLEMAVEYFIKAYKIFKEDNILPAEKLISVYEKNKELYLTKVKKENINEKEICTKVLASAEKSINGGNFEKAARQMSIVRQLGFDDINKKITSLERRIIEKRVDNYIRKGIEAVDSSRMQLGKSYLSKARELSSTEPAKGYRLEEVEKKLSEIKEIEERMLRPPEIRKEPEVKPKEKPAAIAGTGAGAAIDSKLKVLDMKSIPASEKEKIAAEVFKLLDTTENLEGLVKIFAKYDDKAPYFRSLKFKFFKNLAEEFKNTNLDKYCKYFESYMKYGWVDPKEVEEYMLKKTAKGIRTFVGAKGYLVDKISKNYKNEKNRWEIELKNGMKFIFIPAGIYRLQSKYVFVDSYLIGKYEITNRYYAAFCQQKRIKFRFNKNKPNYPAVNMNWNYSRMYCQWLSEQTGLNIDLPTEAQWEKAALSGSSTIYFWGDSINKDYLWYWGNSGFKLHQVGEKLPNHWGIYDVSGNAAEWTKDWFAPADKDTSSRKYFKSSIGPERGSEKVVKGGGWYSSHKEVTIPYRGARAPQSREKTTGFRVVINLNNPENFPD